MAALCLARAVHAAPYSTPEQPTAIWRAEWRDAKRDRVVPVKIYYPTGPGPYPVIVFSHGLGGSREGYEYLGTYWAAHGFVAVHLQHIGSDDSLWKNGGGMEGMRGGLSLQSVQDRPRDVSFALDQLQKLNQDAAWPPHGKLDLTRIGMAGHSFGANTTLLVSGAKAPLGASLADSRVKCAIAMSSPPPYNRNYATLYAGIKIPVFHMTGTKDTTQFEPPGSTPLDRRIPYDNSTDPAYLLTFAGGDHMLFSGRAPASRIVASDARNHLLIQEATTAFWDAYLKSDAAALAWLQNDFKSELGTNGVFEQRRGH